MLDYKFQLGPTIQHRVHVLVAYEYATNTYTLCFIVRKYSERFRKVRIWFKQYLFTEKTYM